MFQKSCSKTGTLRFWHISIELSKAVRMQKKATTRPSGGPLYAPAKMAAIRKRKVFCSRFVEYGPLKVPARDRRLASLIARVTTIKSMVPYQSRHSHSRLAKVGCHEKATFLASFSVVFAPFWGRFSTCLALLSQCIKS